MSAITIPACEVKAGDVIDFGGMACTVTKVEAVGDGATIWYRAVERPYTELPHYTIVRPDQPLTVTRPDPDAELVEVMARAICATYIKTSGAPDWDALVGDNIGGRDEYRREARAALTAARESGLL